MAPRPSAALVEALRATLQKVEQSSDLGPDDPALIHLKRILLRRVAELEALELGPIANTVEDTAIAVRNQSSFDPGLEPVIRPDDVAPLIQQAASESPIIAMDPTQVDRND